MSSVMRLISNPMKITLCASAVMSVGMVGCKPGEIPHTDAGTGNNEVGAYFVCPTGTSEMQAQVLAVRCAAAGCHGTTMSALSLDWSRPIWRRAW